MPVITNKPLSIAKVVIDLDTVFARFNRIRWFRSRTGANGVYEAATGPAATSAQLRSGSAEPHALDGKTLSLKVDGVTIDVAFAGPDPTTTADVIAAIAAETALVVGSDDDGFLVLTAASTGSGSSIEILESDGAVALGFVTGTAALGLDADLVMNGDTHDYQYTDENSSKDFWYKTQYVNSLSPDESELSVPLPASAVPALPYSATIACYVKLVDMRGRPIDGRKIIIANTFLPNRVVGYGVFRHYEEARTDEDGVAEIRLLRGSTFDLHVEGTGFTRRITLPTDADIDIVDLLDPDLVTEDEFGIQEPNIDFAIRTS
jgi:hypothetical protein